MNLDIGVILNLSQVVFITNMPVSLSFMVIKSSVLSALTYQSQTPYIKIRAAYLGLRMLTFFTYWPTLSIPKWIHNFVDSTTTLCFIPCLFANG